MENITKDQLSKFVIHLKASKRVKSFIEIAEEIGVTRQTVAYIRTKSVNPNETTILALKYAYPKAWEDFFKEKEETTKPNENIDQKILMLQNLKIEKLEEDINKLKTLCDNLISRVDSIESNTQ